MKLIWSEQETRYSIRGKFKMTRDVIIAAKRMTAESGLR